MTRLGGHARAVWLALLAGALGGCLGADVITHGAASNTCDAACPGADLIPAERRIDWSTAGVPGGVPHRTTICATVTEAPYHAQGDGVTDDTAAIKAAIDGCTVDGVVLLPPGTYRITAPLSSATHDRFTLRGAGPGKTIIRVDFPASCQSRSHGVFDFGDAPSSIRNLPILAGATRGSTRLTLGSAGPAVGDLLLVTTLNDPALVTPIGYAGNTTPATRDGDGERALQQVVKVTGASAAVIEVAPPLVWDFAAQPEASTLPRTVHGIGFEDFAIDDVAGYAEYHFILQNADSCWIRGIESRGAFRWVLASYTLQLEIRDSWFHAADVRGRDSCFGGNSPATVSLVQSSSALVENNLLDGASNEMLGVTGSVVGYNVVLDVVAAPDSGLLTAALSSSDGAHGLLNLFEGNRTTELQAGDAGGSSSHTTLFRNHLRGTDPPGVVNNQKPISLDANQQLYTVMGNVLGTPTVVTGWDVGSAQAAAWTYEAAGIDLSYVTPVIYRLGYLGIANNGLDGYDPRVKATLLRGGNYDYATHSVVWQATAPDSTDTYAAERALPASLYRTAKPCWFGAAGWPPIGPDVADLAGELPAERCRAAALSTGTFDPAGCYPCGD